MPTSWKEDKIKYKYTPIEGEESPKYTKKKEKTK